MYGSWQAAKMDDYLAAIALLAIEFDSARVLAMVTVAMHRYDIRWVICIISANTPTTRA